MGVGKLTVSMWCEYHVCGYRCVCGCLGVWENYYKRKRPYRTMLAAVERIPYVHTLFPPLQGGVDV